VSTSIGKATDCYSSLQGNGAYDRIAGEKGISQWQERRPIQYRTQYFKNPFSMRLLYSAIQPDFSNLS
jgi:hypothetical protein